MSSNKIKEIVKEAEVTEGNLNQYLLAKGINPKFVSKETKISHAKSSTFLKWKNDHKFEEIETEESLVEDAMLDKFLMSRGINPKYVQKNQKVAHAKSQVFIKWKHDHMQESVSEAVDKKDTITLDIPLMIRVLELAREDIKSDMDLHRVVERLIDIRNRGTLTMDDYDFIAHIKEEYAGLIEAKTIQGTALDKFRQAAAERAKKHDEIEKKQSKSGEGMSSAIDRLQKHMNKEDVFQDPQAATQTVFDNGTSTNDTSIKGHLSKSARLIKSLYKKLNMKEDTYDWEKDDKNQTSPGKKTTQVKEKPEARAILTGGKTLTGEKRDTLEIDPMMKNRPDLNGTVKDNDNSKKNNKINN